jgi:hypothetical protein
MALLTKSFDVSSLSINDTVNIFSEAYDPITTGKDAPAGSLLLRTDGTLYQKIAGDQFAWLKFGEGTGSGISIVSASAAFTAETLTKYIIDTSGGSFDVTMPTSPAVNDYFIASPAGATYTVNPVTFKYGADPIQSLSEDFIHNVNSQELIFLYQGGSVGWAIYNTGRFGDGVALEVRYPTFTQTNTAFNIQPNQHYLVDTIAGSVTGTVVDNPTDGYFAQIMPKSDFNTFDLLLDRSGTGTATIDGTAVLPLHITGNVAVHMIYDQPNDDWIIKKVSLV